MSKYLADFTTGLIYPEDAYKFNVAKEKWRYFFKKQYDDFTCDLDKIKLYGENPFKDVMFKSRAINHVSESIGLHRNAIYMSSYFLNLLKENLNLPLFDDMPIKVKIKGEIHEDYHIVSFYQNILGFIDFEKSEMICGNADYDTKEWQEYDLSVNEKVNSCQEFLSFQKHYECRIEIIDLVLKKQYQNLDFIPASNNNVVYTPIVSERFLQLMKDNKVKKIKFLDLDKYLLDFRSRF